MRAENITVMRKILYSVESGRQVYGNQDYAAFAGVGENTDNEKAITIGAGQWYAGEARRLLRTIRSNYPSDFEKYDTAGISADLEKSWSHYGVSKTSAKGKSIIAIISCPNGIKCQDALMEEQIKEYVVDINKTHDSMGDDAMMECVNIIHHGGADALKRILAKTKKPYTAKSIFDALNTDPADKSNNNQVGDYESRQKAVYQFITKYAKYEKEVKEDTAMGKTANDVLDVMRGWLGYSEANGKYREIIDLYNSVKPLPRGYAVQYDDEWCDTTVSAAGIKAGCSELIGRECGCEQHVKIFQQMGIWEENGSVSPKAGWVILFNWGDATQPNDGYSDHIGYVESVKNGTIVCIEGNKGEAVARRSIPVGWGYIRGYAKIQYASGAGQGTGVSNNGGTTTSGSTRLNRTPKWVGESTVDGLAVRKWAGTEYAKITSWPSLNKGNQFDVCDTVKDKEGRDWYYVRIDGRIYGFIASWYVKKSGGDADIDVGDIVNFTGNTHYTSADAKTGKPCKPGRVQVTRIYRLGESKHPYHVKKVDGGGSTAFGWVDADELTK